MVGGPPGESHGSDTPHGQGPVALIGIEAKELLVRDILNLPTPMTLVVRLRLSAAGEKGTESWIWLARPVIWYCWASCRSDVL